MNKTAALKQFLNAFDQDGTELTMEALALGASLISEEHNELQAEFDKVMGYALKTERVPQEIIQNFIKELADLVYVCYWTAARFDIDLDEAFRRVHLSNMSKVGPNGKVIKAPNGKVLKPEGYHKPKLADLALRAQR
jgi:predicted HAD superfamily Cof-like phosphohydrolase